MLRTTPVGIAFAFLIITPASKRRFSSMLQFFSDFMKIGGILIGLVFDNVSITWFGVGSVSVFICGVVTSSVARAEKRFVVFITSVVGGGDAHALRFLWAGVTHSAGNEVTQGAEVAISIIGVV